MAEAYEQDPRGAAIEFRKHLGWYVKGVPHSADLRRQLHAVESLGQVESIFGSYLERVRCGELGDVESADGASNEREPALT
jgi:tRNA-dihydrouridine synthase